jgi:hypothetical protein
MEYFDFSENLYLLIIDALLFVGLIYFILLGAEKRVNKLYWLLFFVLFFTVFYENFGSYLIYNSTLNARINAFLGNIENPNYNIWFFNLSYSIIIACCYLLILRIYVSSSLKRPISFLLFSFLTLCLVLHLFKIEPIYGPQIIIYTIGSSFVLISCILFFISLMKDPIYLEVNPLRLLSFWQVTVILFYYSLTFLTNNSMEYLWKTQPLLAGSLGKINMFFGILSLVVIVFIIAAPNLNIKLEKEPAHV